MNERPWALYVRVSSDMQLDGGSLEAQDERGREAIEREAGVVFDIYRDEARSASSADRADFRRLLGDARAGRIRGVMAWNLSRLSRNTEDKGILEKLERLGVHLHSVIGGRFTLRTSVGKLSTSMQLAVGEFQLDELRENTTRGKLHRAQRGETNASWLPWGYVRAVAPGYVPRPNGRIDTVVTPNADAPIVRELFERYATGNYSDQDIAAWLNGLGKVTFGAWGSRAFSKDTVSGIIRNAYYAGKVMYRGTDPDRLDETVVDEYWNIKHKRRFRRSKTTTQWLDGIHTAIVPMELFEECQRVRASRSRRMPGRKPVTDRVYMLRKRLVCSACGKQLRSTFANNRQRYYCTTIERGGTCAATKRSIAEATLMVRVGEMISRINLSERLMDQAIEIIETGDQNAAQRRDADRLEAELRRVGRVYELGNCSDAEYEAKSAAIKKKLATLARPTQVADTSAAIEHARRMAGLWAGATPAEKQEIVATLVEDFEMDLSAGQLIGVEPKKRYAALFRAAYPKSGSDGHGIPVRGSTYWLKLPSM